MSNFNLASSLHKHGIISDEEMGKHIDKALSSQDYYEKRLAIEHPAATSANIDKALDKDQSSMVRRVAIKHPNVTAAHIDKALGDKDNAVFEYAMRIRR